MACVLSINIVAFGVDKSGADNVDVTVLEGAGDASTGKVTVAPQNGVAILHNLVAGHGLLAADFVNDVPHDITS